MTRGRKPKPTHLKLIDGTQGCRINKNEIEPEAVIPDPPVSLVGRARDEWDLLAAELHKLKLLTKIDRAALAAYCQSWAMFSTAVDALNEMAARDELTHGLMIKTKAGNAIQNPLVGAINKSASAMVRYAVEFGMTPSARSRIAATDGLAKEPLAHLLNLPNRRA